MQALRTGVIFMRLYLGIDGGQTETRSILATENGQVLGIGRSGPCQHPNRDTSRESSRESLFSAVRAVLETSGMSESSEIDSAFLGITGVTDPSTQAAHFYRSALADRFRVSNLTVDIDARSALAGAIPFQPGIVVISGTGSVGFGVDSEGNTFRTGGWGYLIGDPGSGFEIGRQALGAVLHCHERGGPHTRLTEMILRNLEIDQVGLIPQSVHLKENPKVYIAGISRLVTQAAEQGDAVSLEILATAGRHLASLAVAILEKLHWSDQKIPVSGVGGVLRTSAQLWEQFCDGVVQLEPRARVDVPELPPLAGALLLAYQQDGLPWTTGLVKKLQEQQSIKEFLSDEIGN
ncbi:MAG TPA: BadF/BadG/BcrA/BcrD ATPase family protein [Terriglobia bacterium]|nr:BadF/BadG/BcrA/BcrD ATPase family protein [Terriglobia bacterium]